MSTGARERRDDRESGSAIQGSNRNDVSILAKGCLVPGHRRQLVHEAELHQSAEPGDEAVMDPRGIEACGIVHAREHLDVPVWHAQSAESRHGLPNRRRIVQDREHLSIRIADEFPHAGQYRRTSPHLAAPHGTAAPHGADVGSQIGVVSRSCSTT
jgi:hypothetical protein